jgi:hypothetical protein
MDTAYEYVYKIIDVCVSELTYQVTGDNGKLNER